MTGPNDPAREPSPAGEEDVAILFDGACSMCGRWARFVAARDPARRFRLLALQSDEGRRLAAGHGIDPETVDTVVVLDAGRLLTRSDAVLRILRGLRPPWPLLHAFVVVPRPVRDAVYRRIAARRTRREKGTGTISRA